MKTMEAGVYPINRTSPDDMFTDLLAPPLGQTWGSSSTLKSSELHSLDLGLYFSVLHLQYLN